MVTAGGHLPAPLHRLSPANTADALEQIARAQAMSGWLKDLEARHREFLVGQADVVESATGGAFNVPVSGVGRVQRTDPAPTVAVTDATALVGWLAEVSAYETLDIVVEHRPVARITDPIAAGKILTGTGHDDGWVGRLLELLVVDEQTLLSEGAADVIVAHPRAKVEGDRVRWADPDGNLQEVPGLTVTQGRRDLRVTIDRDAKAHLRGELETLIGPPTLTGPDNTQETP